MAPPSRVNMSTEDPEDEPGAEMAKGARVWRIYVRETDQWDKEMVDGRNNSLDVLLTALFSAVSTAFIIQSLGDLRPDPATLSAQTLVVISRKLGAISTGNYTTLSPAEDPSPDEFSPPYSAIIVNVLWLVSLSLSVAVSLVAILSKEWCYNFMSGRSGQIYDQARRRQERWNGIDRWKMQEMLAYLPGLMHLALLLFAIGLCTYLWKINVCVAAPVTLIIWMVTCSYAFATFLPLVDPFCPYSTPATPIARFSYPLWKEICYFAYLFAINVSWELDFPTWLKSAGNNEDASEKKEQDAAVPMDFVTSQMLAWMIANCEDSRSVDSALQAIGGARPELPHVELAKARAIEVLDARIKSCMRWERASGRYQLKDPAMAQTALGYTRSYTAVMFGGGYKCKRDQWTDWYEASGGGRWTSGRDVDEVARVHISLLRDIEVTGENSSALAVAMAGPITLSRWDWNKWYLPADAMALSTSIEDVVEQATQLLIRHIHKDIAISDHALMCLLESCAHYMIGRWPKQQSCKRFNLPTALILVFVFSRDSASDLARTVAITLAAAAFAMNPYCSLDQQPQSAEYRERRAVQIFDHYRSRKPDGEELDDLFTFGLFGLLPYLNLGQLGAPSTIINELQNITATSLSYRDVRVIHSLPQLYSWASYCHSSYYKLLYWMSKDSDQFHSCCDYTWPYILLLPDNLKLVLCLPTIVCLAHTRSTDLQEACIDVLKSLPIVNGELDLNALLGADKIISALFSPSLRYGDRITPIIVFYFRFLVAIIMLNSEKLLPERQSALRKLIGVRREFQYIKPTSYASALPNEEYILEHVADRASGQSPFGDILCTMQVVVDFCNADTIRYSDHRLPGDISSSGGWPAKLREIKTRFDSSILLTFDGSNSSPSHVEDLC